MAMTNGTITRKSDRAAMAGCMGLIWSFSIQLMVRGIASSQSENRTRMQTAHVSISERGWVNFPFHAFMRMAAVGTMQARPGGHLKRDTAADARHVARSMGN